MSTRRARALTIAAVATAVLVAGAPMALGHGVSGGPLGPQQIGGPAGTVGDAATQDHCDPIDPRACLLPSDETELQDRPSLRPAGAHCGRKGLGSRFRMNHIA